VAPKRSRAALGALLKAPSALTPDEITGGGLPRGRPTLVCGGPGCGKTLFALEFLVRAPWTITSRVSSCRSRRARRTRRHVAALGFDLRRLEAERRSSSITCRGALRDPADRRLRSRGLFVRLQFAIDTVGAKRVALDTIESLCRLRTRHPALRAAPVVPVAEGRGMTVVITGERAKAPSPVAASRIRFRLRHLPGPPRPRPGVNAAAARVKYRGSRMAPTSTRSSLASTASQASHHLAGAPPQISTRVCPQAAAPGRDARPQGLFQGLHDSRVRDRRHRQTSIASSSRGQPVSAASAVCSLRTRVRRADHAEHEINWH